MLDSMQEIFDKAEQGGIPFWEVVLQADMEERQVTREESLAKMRATWQAMVEADGGYQHIFMGEMLGTMSGEFAL